MSAARYRMEPMAGHDRSAFRSGDAALDDYLRTRAGQDMRRHIAACFVAVDIAAEQVAGYYTLAACHLDLTDIADDLQRKLPRYPTVPAALLGRLAVDARWRGQGLGGILLADAAARAARSEVAAHMMTVQAKSDTAAAFYRHHGFRPDPGEPLRLYAPIASLVPAGSGR